jgi:hypothetical protein
MNYICELLINKRENFERNIIEYLVERENEMNSKTAPDNGEKKPCEKKFNQNTNIKDKKKELEDLMDIFN